MSDSVREAAITWFKAGFCVIPPQQDGSKRPLGIWKQFQTQRPSHQQMGDWYDAIDVDLTGVGLICGKISGNLEMLELEGRASSSEDLTAIVDEAYKRGVDLIWQDFFERGYVEWTPSGGLHILYRISDHDVPGNTKVARRPADEHELAINPQDKVKVLSETRGEGGYVVVAPSHGEVHPSGQSWDLAVGRFGEVPTISWADRCKLHEAIHAALDQMPTEPVYVAPVRALPTLQGSGDRPGDDFNVKASWEDILTPHGWQAVGMIAGTTYWMRPGKKWAGKGSHSATTGHAGIGAQDRLYVFSSSTEFDTEKPYNKFYAFAQLEHGGDLRAATKDLAARGYGKPLERNDYGKVLMESIPAQTSVAVPVNAVVEKAVPPAGDVVDYGVDWQVPRIHPRAFSRSDFTFLDSGDIYASTFHEVLKYCKKEKEWYFWTGKVWQQDECDRFEQASKILMKAAMREAQRATADEELYAKPLMRHALKLTNGGAPTLPRWAQSDPRMAVSPSAFNSKRNFITVDNGTLDLSTLTFLGQHDPSLLLTKAISIGYDKDAQADGWQRFLQQVLPDPEIRSYVQRAIGHTILGDVKERALFLLHGESGTGKSQFIKAMELMFGDFAQTADPKTFNASSRNAAITNDLNDLKGSRFVAVSELDEGDSFNESLIKRLTGGDTAKSRAMYQENTTWRVEFTMWMASNHLPKLNSDDNAIWRRMKPIEFPTVIKDHGEEIGNFAEKLVAEEGPGILNWILEGVRMYREEGLEDLPQIVKAVESYRHEVDSVAQFIEEAVEDGRLVKNPAGYIPARNLHLLYSEWCKENNIRWLGVRRFSARMQSLKYERSRTASSRLWMGLSPGGLGLLGTMMPPMLT